MTHQLNSGYSFLRVNEVNLETLWCPTAGSTGVTWVLLHEGLGCVELWRDFPKRLSHRYKDDAVFVWSRRGYGKSDPVSLPRPIQYMSLEATDNLPSLLKYVPGERLILLGHSDGASIAALYSGLCEDCRVVGALLVAPHFFAEDIALNAIAKTTIDYEQGELRRRLQKYHGSNVDCAFRGWNEAWLASEFKAWDIRHCLANIKVPVVLVQGEQDKYGTLAQLDAVSDLCPSPQQRFVIAECDHWPHVEAPETLLEASDVLRELAI